MIYSSFSGDDRILSQPQTKFPEEPSPDPSDCPTLHGVIDSHCHLDCYDDPHSMIQSATQAGVEGFLTIGTSRSSSTQVVALANQYSHVYGCVGIHPGYCHEDCDEETVRDWLISHSHNPKVVALGETGLDQMDTSPCLSLQERYFRAHIQAAQNTGLPLVVHTRNSDDLFLKVMLSYCASQRPMGVLHCFTGSLECALQAVSWGWKVSMSGIVTFKNAHDVQAMARSLPLSALLVETDSPWLAPQSRRGQKNQPAYIIETVKFLANLHTITPQEMANLTRRNFFSLFQKACP